MQVNKKLDLEKQKPSVEECSKEPEKESPNYPDKEDNKETDRKELSAKLKQNNLCPIKWLSIFEELGIDTVGKLQFVDLEEIKILKDKAKFLWEKNILSTFLGEEPKKAKLVELKRQHDGKIQDKKAEQEKLQSEIVSLLGTRSSKSTKSSQDH